MWHTGANLSLNNLSGAGDLPLDMNRQIFNRTNRQLEMVLTNLIFLFYCKLCFGRLADEAHYRIFSTVALSTVSRCSSLVSNHPILYEIAESISLSISALSNSTSESVVLRLTKYLISLRHNWFRLRFIAFCHLFVTLQG